MRRVTSPNFCSPCLEGLWLALLTRVDLIDSLEVQITSTPARLANAGHFLLASLMLVPFGELRHPPVVGEEYEITWRRNGQVIRGAANSTVLSMFILPADEGHVEMLEVVDGGGKEVYDVEVVLHTPEVRKDAKGRLRAARTFHLA